MKDSIKLAEHFYSIQGEGPTMGTPSIFLRLSMCNFNCSWCDTVEVWKKGEWIGFEQLDALMELNFYYTKMEKGAHLILTGGDPLIQQDALIQWFNLITELTRETDRFFTELETQGHIMPKKDLARYVRQWNVSPKLSNSGIPRERRLNREVLKFHASVNSCFKFPIAAEQDLREVDDIVYSMNIRRTKVYLMPVANTRAELEQRSPMVVELAKKSGYRFSSRMQLSIWDKATGV